MDPMHINNVAMHLSNASQELYSLASNSGPGHEITLQEHQDFIRMGNDLVIQWNDNGVHKELSLNQAHEFLNGNTMDQINQLLETVTNLEERLESMEFYGDDSNTTNAA